MRDRYDDLELAVDKMLTALGIERDENVTDTPARVAKALRDQLWGYSEDPTKHLAVTFPAASDPGVIIQAGIDVQSTCSHHLLPFGGRATVAYRPRPGQRVVGLSKLTRVVYGYAARLQLQERIGAQVVEALMSKLDPQGAICIISASHDCMRLRGVRSPASETTTEAQAGEWSESDIDLIHLLHMRQVVS